MKVLSLTTTGIAAVLGISLVALAARRPAQSQAEQCAARLATFDTLDFDVFSHQK